MDDLAKTLIRKYYEELGLVTHHLDSYNHFTRVGIQEVIDQAPPIVVDDIPGKNITIKFGQLYISRPTITETNEQHLFYPSEARRRKLTYNTPLHIDILQTEIKGEEVKKKVFNQVYIGRLPVMLRSELCNLSGMTRKELCEHHECPYDFGGYFIGNGNERVLVSFENMSTNNVYVFDLKGNYVVQCRSIVSPIFIYPVVKADINKIEMTSFHVSFPNVKDLPICTLFTALGAGDFFQYLFRTGQTVDDLKYFDLLYKSYEDSYVVNTKKKALLEIARKSGMKGGKDEELIAKAKDIIRGDVLPHLGISDACNIKKAYFLGYMLRRLLSVLTGERKEDDRDHYGNKRIDTSGALMQQLFRKVWKKVRMDTEKEIRRLAEKNKDFDVDTIISPSTLTKGLTSPITTGNWGLTNQDNVKTGVSQLLNRLTYISALSHLRRVVSPNNKDSKLAKLRQLHNSTWGYLCPTESPEGKNCGILKNMALMGSITIRSREEIVRAILQKNIDSDFQNDGFMVFVNGDWVGVCNKPEKLVKKLKRHRKKGNLGADVSIVLLKHEQEVRVYTDGGRLVRPVIKLKKGKIPFNLNLINELSFSELVERGYVACLGIEEQEINLISPTSEYALQQIKKWEYCEIHPSLILGICASSIPFPDRNPGPRNTYESAMIKQAIGVYGLNFRQRMDTSHVLCYPQKPIVQTEYMQYFNTNVLPTGQNVTFAIMCYGGYNQEDSILMNLGAIQRGLFRSAHYRIFTDEEEPKQKIGKPNPKYTIAMKQNANYGKLDHRGIIKKHSLVEDLDVLVSKTVSLKDDEVKKEAWNIDGSENEGKKEMRRDTSLIFKGTETGWVEDVDVTTNAKGYKYVKIKICSVRIPQIGDKFASRQAQKGTVGMIYPQEDMPFIEETGVSPDIIMNTHAIPSRMTLATFIETLTGKVGAEKGEFRDATSFCHSKVSIEEMKRELKDLGYNSDGEEWMRNGMTGERLKVMVFTGPAYYQKLKHMVIDKVHARSRGKVVSYTRQPVEGRARDGGLRFGKLFAEVWVVIHLQVYVW